MGGVLALAGHVSSRAGEAPWFKDSTCQSPGQLVALSGAADGHPFAAELRAQMLHNLLTVERHWPQLIGR